MGQQIPAPLVWLHAGRGHGARVNEVAQLYVDDVAEVGGHWGIHIRALRPTSA